MNAIKRMEAVKQRGGHSRKNDALIQDSPGVCRQVVADGARGGVAHSPWLEMALHSHRMERSRVGTGQFVTAPREADETSSAYLAITPDV